MWYGCGFGNCGASSAGGSLIATTEEEGPVEPEQVLAWQLEGLTQEQIREEVNAHGLDRYPDIAFLSAPSAAGANTETIRAVQHAPGPRRRWGLALRLPKSTDYLYGVQARFCGTTGSMLF